MDSTKKFYRAELEPVNFKYTEEEAREKINFWVENETKGKEENVQVVWFPTEPVRNIVSEFQFPFFFSKGSDIFIC